MSNENSPEIQGIFGGAGGTAKAALDVITERKDDLGDALDLVRDHGDELLDALKWLRDHGDELVSLADRIPGILGRSGAALETAGKATATASGFLAGSRDGVDAQDLLKIVAEALDDCVDQLQAVSRGFDTIGDKLEAFGIGGQVSDSSNRIQGVATSLDTASDRLRKLGVLMGRTGRQLSTVGDDLGSSGQALVELTGHGATSGATAPAPTRRVPRPRTSTSIFPLSFRTV